MPIPNPGRFGDWRELQNTITGDIAYDWPYSADGHQQKAEVSVEIARFAEERILGQKRNLENKQWLCITSGRMFLYHHDHIYYIIIIEGDVL